MSSRALPVSCVFGLIAFAIVRSISVWDALPPDMASHFGPSGRPDGWQSRAAFFATFGGIGFGTVLLLLAILVGINYVARLSPYDRSKESLSLDPRWNQAVNVFLMRNFGRKFSLSGDLKYDTLTTDRLAMFRATYKATKELHVSLGVNMIGTPADGKSYWSPYTNNDAIFGSLRYVF